MRSPASFVDRSSSLPFQGNPTADLLTVNIYDPIFGGKKKWEMVSTTARVRKGLYIPTPAVSTLRSNAEMPQCCTSREQQLQWYRAINAFDGKPTEGRFSEQGRSPGACSDRASTPTAPGNQMINSPCNKYSAPDLARLVPPAVDEELVARAAARAVQILQEDGGGGSLHPPPGTWSVASAAAAVLVANVALHVVRTGSDSAYRMALLATNAVLLYWAATAARSPAAARLKGPRARAAEERSTGGNSASPAAAAPSPTAAHRQAVEGAPDAAMEAGRTMPRAPPIPGTELSRAVDILGESSEGTVRARAASGPDSIRTEPHSYGSVDASTFRLRVGPNYKKNKRKEPSGPALCDLVTMDLLFGSRPLRRVSDRFELPDVPGVTDADTGHGHIPPVIVVNTWLPGEEPSMFGGGRGGDGGGDTYSIPLVFALSRDTLDQLQDLDTASPAVRLFSEWCRRAEDEADFRGRFKCMGMIEDVESSGVPQFIAGYNGKPALVTKSGTFTRHGGRYIEFTINVDRWGYLARKGLCALTPSFPNFVLNIGFTIEGRGDDELPEALLGGVRVANLDPDRAYVLDA